MHAIAFANALLVVAAEAETQAQEALVDFKERLKDEEDNETIGLCE